MRWFGHVQRRDAGHIGRKILKMELPGKRKRRKAKEEVYGYGEGRHAGSWHDRGRCRGQEEMETDATATPNGKS